MVKFKPREEFRDDDKYHYYPPGYEMNNVMPCLYCYKDTKSKYGFPLNV